VAGLALASAAVVLGAVSTPALAQWPDRPVQVLVPFPAGGVVDVLARGAAQAMSEQTGGSFVVVNRDGASGAIAARALAAARPDGHTLGFFPAGPITTQPHLVRNAGYERTSFTPLCQIFAIPYALAAAPDGRFATLQDALAAARAQPGRISLGYGGNGTAAHFALLGLLGEAQVDLLAVPFRGDPPLATALRAGDVDMAVLTAGTVFGTNLRPLATLTAERLADAPGVPTATELGVPVVEQAFGGLVAPAGLPAALAARLEAACLLAAGHPRVVDTLRTARLVPVQRGAEGFGRALAVDEQAKRALIQSRGLVE
jgi:tripartite-type tricarboxylate transporter receptor subunit TctC